MPIFNVYVIYHQLQITRIRRQLTDQVLALDKVEGLALEVYRMALIDPLTGLFNRRYIEQRLEDQIKRSQRHGRALSVILFDLDEFKLSEPGECGKNLLRRDRLPQPELGGALSMIKLHKIPCITVGYSCSLFYSPKMKAGTSSAVSVNRVNRQDCCQ